ncbi:MAG: F0F1 ATP synthase subunit B [Nitrospinae bacterium]|nr:F0F1 ATP synthase subunit B [Nitrospinota bacterium]
MKGAIKSKNVTTVAYLLVMLVVAAPCLAGAEEGIQHGEKFEMRRDGAFILNFLVLLSGAVWVVYRFLLPLLKTRTEEIAATMEQTENARREAESRLAELEEKMREFEVQSAKIKKDAVDEGEQIKAKIIKEATAVAAGIIEKAKLEIDSEALKAQNRLRKEAVELSTGLAAEILSRNFNENDQRNSVKDYINGVNMSGGAR